MGVWWVGGICSWTCVDIVTVCPHMPDWSYLVRMFALPLNFGLLLYSRFAGSGSTWWPPRFGCFWPIQILKLRLYSKIVVQALVDPRLACKLSVSTR